MHIVYQRIGQKDHTWFCEHVISLLSSRL